MIERTHPKLSVWAQCQLWVRPGYSVDRGTIYGPDGWSERLVDHLKDEIEIIK